MTATTTDPVTDYKLPVMPSIQIEDQRYYTIEELSRRYEYSAALICDLLRDQKITTWRLAPATPILIDATEIQRLEDTPAAIRLDLRGRAASMQQSLKLMRQGA